jgi:hypothetical protein
MQQHTERAAVSATLSCPGLLHHCGRNECPHSTEAQPTSTKLIQANNANSSSLNDMFEVVTLIFQQIMTELNGAKSQVNRIMAITKIVL